MENTMKKHLICLSLSAALLSGCGLTAGGPTEDPSEHTGREITSSVTSPAAQSGSVPAALPGTIPDTVPATIPDTEPETIPGTTAGPLPDTTAVASNSQADAPDLTEQPQHILAQSANAMLQADSYEYTQTSVSDFGETKITSVTEAVMFPVRGDGMITSEEAGYRNTTYLKDNIMYREDTATGQWVFLPVEAPDDGPVRIHERVNGYLEALKTEEGYVISSIRPLDLMEFYSITGIEEKEQETIRILQEQGVTLETMVEIWLDEEYRFQKVIYDQVTTAAGISTGTLDEYEYHSYGTAPEVTVPQDVLDQAVEYDPDYDDPEEP